MLRPRTGLGFGWSDVAAITFAPQLYFGYKELKGAAKIVSPSPASLAPTTSASAPVTTPVVYTTPTPINPILYIGVGVAALGLIVFMMKRE